MGTIPIATPTPPRRWRFSRRVLPLLLLGAIFAAFLIVMAAVAWPDDAGAPGAGIVDAGRINELPNEEPVRHEAGFFLVKLESGEVIALSETDPHVFGTSANCPITWRPEMQFNSMTGWLRGTCSGSNFTVTGDRVSGPSPRGMDRFPVTVSESGGISVDTRTRLCAPDYTPHTCP